MISVSNVNTILIVLLVLLFGREVTLVSGRQPILLKATVQKTVLPEEVIALRFESTEEAAREHHKQHAEIAVDKLLVESAFAFLKMPSELVLKMRQHNGGALSSHFLAILGHVLSHDQSQLVLLLLTVLTIRVNDHILGNFDLDFVKNFQDHRFDDLLGIDGYCFLC